MTDSPSKKIHTYFNTDHADLQFIFAKIKRLQEVSQYVAMIMPPQLAPYCQVANLSRHTLTILTTNAATATQLRYRCADLIKQFSQVPALKSIMHIECKVRPSTSTLALKNPSKPMSLLTAKTASLIREVAESITDPHLKEIMQRIAGREKK